MPREEKEASRKIKSEGHPTEGHPEEYPEEEGAQGASLLTSAALIGIGALIEPELLAGMAIGAGIVFASRWLPGIVGDVIRPVAKTAVKAGYAAASAAREMAAKVTEEVEDMVAEVRAEQGSPDQVH